MMRDWRRNSVWQQLAEAYPGIIVALSYFLQQDGGYLLREDGSPLQRES